MKKGMSAREAAFLKEGKEYVEKTLKLKKTGDGPSSENHDGNYGVVYFCEDQFGKKHAVKICIKPPEFSDKKSERKYLDNEIVLHKRLKHRNVVELYDGFSFPEYTILDMEMCDITLYDYYQRSGTLSESVFRELARQTTAGIFYLHSVGVVHRDIKPKNIMLCLNKDGTFVVKIADFGFAKKEQEALVSAVGSPAYEAPEVIANFTSRKYSKVCDMWSLGIVYYELLTSKFPFISRKLPDLRMELVSKVPAAFELPPSVNVSECCKHFIKSHLYKDQTLRITAEEALKHPFLLPTVMVVEMVNPVTTKSLVETIVHKAELSDYIFDQTKRILGSRINDSHAVKPRVFWKDVVNFIKLEDRSILNDLRIISNYGNMFNINEPVPFWKDGIFDDVVALFVSATNGVVMEDTNVDHRIVLPDEKEEELPDPKSIDKPNIEIFNKYVKVVKKYLKNCSALIKANKILYDNSSGVETFRLNVMNFEEIGKEISGLIKEVLRKKNFEVFSDISYVVPKTRPSVELVYNSCGSKTKHDINDGLTELCGGIQLKVNSGKMDITASEFKSVVEMYDKIQSVFHVCKTSVDETCKAMHRVMEPFALEVDKLCHLLHLRRVLKKALEVDDVHVIYPELRSLVQCEFLNVSDHYRTEIIGTSSSSSDSLSSSSSEASVADLKQRIKSLEVMNIELRTVLEKSEYERNSIISQAEESISSLTNIISILREELRSNSIQDPTLE